MMLFPQEAQLTIPHLASALALEGNIKSSIIACKVKYIFEASIKAGMEILQKLHHGIKNVVHIFFLGLKVNA